LPQYPYSLYAARTFSAALVVCSPLTCPCQIFAIISFFSYRFFRQYTYYSVSEVRESIPTSTFTKRVVAQSPPLAVYEAIVVSAFMFLLVESIAATTEIGTTQAALLKKDKNKLPAPVSLRL
jgi:hypothetical protein